MYSEIEKMLSTICYGFASISLLSHIIYMNMTLWTFNCFILSVSDNVVSNKFSIEIDLNVLLV
jgi:hypothetical protein